LFQRKRGRSAAGRENCYPLYSKVREEKKGGLTNFSVRARKKEEEKRSGGKRVFFHSERAAGSVGREKKVGKNSYSKEGRSSFYC